MDNSRAIVIAGCWLSIALIASVYNAIFADKLADVLFGVFLPAGALVLVGLAATFLISSGKNGR